MNWTYTDCNSSREIPRYICIFFFVKLKKKNFFFFFSFFFVFFFNFFIFYFLLKFPTTPPLLLNFHFHIFLWFFSIREKIFVFLSFFWFFFFFFLLFFFLFSFLSFLFLVFLSYCLLKSSNTPLLFPNFHFHRNITLPKKKEEREKPYFQTELHIYF